MKTKLGKVVVDLENLRKDNPSQGIIIETSKGTISCKLGDTLIYVGMNGDLVIDAE